MSGPEKPIIHGADHLPDAADPIPGLVIGDAGITEITSSDGSVTIGSPTGPIADLHVVFPAPPSAGIVFNTPNWESSGTGRLMISTSPYFDGSGSTAGTIFMYASGYLQLYATTGVHMGCEFSSGYEQSLELYSKGNPDAMTLRMTGETNLFWIKSGGTDLMKIQKVSGVWQYHIKSGASWVADL